MRPRGLVLTAQLQTVATCPLALTGFTLTLPLAGRDADRGPQGFGLVHLLPGEFGVLAPEVTVRGRLL